MTEPILQVENLVKHFPVKKKTGVDRHKQFKLSAASHSRSHQVKPWALLANQDAEKPLPAAHF